MNKTRTYWESLPDVKPVRAIDAGIVEQPGFGIQIGWNRPAILWQPFIILWLWNLRLQIGWVYE
ncbi:hypothetical protein LCGC14_0993100 [marine sediment metagenome]|uniref:Uncharacterized protein n=1 Tax=marine sediment metagenome TaxID=412755 RepID=A0A0F9NRR1_9ZZZZ